MPAAVPFDRANAVQRSTRRLGATRGGSWLFARVLHRVDRPVWRSTHGRHTLTSLLTGLPVVILTTTGARTGRPRTVPVLGIPTEDGLAVIASNFGQDRHPGWYANLRADARATVVVDGVERRVVARLAAGEQRQRVWQRALAIYPGWSTYERRADHREIGVFLLGPE